MTRSVWVSSSWERKWIVIKCSRENWKGFEKLTGVSHQQVARASRQNTQSQIMKKISKCFLWLKGLPARELRAEPWNSLCTLRDRTFHLRTSRQNWLISSRLWQKTCLTCDWVAKTGQHCFWKFSIFVKTKYFPKTPKTLKIFLCLNQQRLSMWKHILSSTITQMNMTFIEHKLVCCV